MRNGGRGRPHLGPTSVLTSMSWRWPPVVWWKNVEYSYGESECDGSDYGEKPSDQEFDELLVKFATERKEIEPFWNLYLRCSGNGLGI